MQNGNWEEAGGAPPPLHLGRSLPRRPRLESPPGSKPSVNSALTGARRRPVPIAQTPLLRQRASPAAARRLFPERWRQRASFAGVRAGARQACRVIAFQEEP
jgi:hypothetical protein